MIPSQGLDELSRRILQRAHSGTRSLTDSGCAVVGKGKESHSSVRIGTNMAAVEPFCVNQSQSAQPFKGLASLG